MRIVGLIVKWLATWVYFVTLVVAFGGVLGVVSHLLFGLFFIADPDYWYLASYGLLNGVTYGGVWAGGTAIVLCFMRGHRERQLETVHEG